MSRSDLKKIMCDFNSISNRLMRADYKACIGDMKRLLKYIDETQFIKNYVDSCGGFSDKMKEKFEKILQRNGRFPFDFSINKEKETSEIYSIIKILCEKYQYIPPALLSAYSSADKNNDMVRDFNHSVILVLIDNINGYMKKVGIDMGLDKNTTFTINGGQVNIANDEATINAVQSNGIGINELKELKGLIDGMRNSLSNDLSDEDKQSAVESIDAIEQELRSNAPNEALVKTHFKLLKKIDSSVKFVSACCSIATFANRFYPFLDQIALMFGQM